MFFRNSVRRRAEAADVSGWARNVPDGTVEAEFEGEADAVEAIVEYCRSGPGRSIVASVDVSEAEPTGEAGFLIR